MRDIVDEKELEQIRFQHEYQISKQIEQGRIMLNLILIINIILNVITLLWGTSTLPQLISQSIIMFFLFIGFNWARFILAILIAAGAILTIHAMPYVFESVSQGMMSPFTALIAIIFAVCQIVICILLVINKSIKEYLYDKRSA